MRFKTGIYSFFCLLLILSSCTASKKVTLFQTLENRQGKTVNLPSYRNDNFIRFRPDDILGITVNVPGEQSVAAEFNLPLVPSATTENSSERSVAQGFGRQAFLVHKDGTIDYPSLGRINVVGYTMGELEKYLKERLMDKSLKEPPIVTVRLMNFKIFVSGEVGSSGIISIDRDHINLFEALALAGDITLRGKRDDVVLFRYLPDGGYERVSVDMTKEEIISSPYYFLHQNDAIYVQPIKQGTHGANISPMLGTTISVGTFAMSLILFVLMFK